MSSRPIMDAGPGLNFLSLNKERLLFSALGPLSVPEIVEREILRKAQQGQDTTILIDDSDGRSFAVQEQRRLQRIRELGVNVGSISLISTITVLTKAAGRPDLPDRKSMRALYGRLRNLDDGLIPLSSTNLMDLPCWR